MIKFINKILSWPLILILKFYKLVLSPWLGVNCRFTPTCSQYAIEALEKHGIFKGIWLTTHRISRCHPWGGSGFDPVSKN
ncbi:MAG: membrane protein insertion efficiency factor YidD [Gammaproteobacteria bacterium]|nr:membrane protein insertion efficiency factor YidD [Gammaproteobacteria bacterium]